MNQWQPSASVVGVGKTKFGPTVKTLVQLMHEAIGDALRDANVRAQDIQAIVVANFLGGPNNAQLHMNSVVAGLLPGLNLPSWRIEAACASGGVAMHQAILALEAYDPILVVGVEHMSGVPGLEITRNIGMAGDVGLDQAAGLTFPANYAIVAQSHMQRYGTTTEDLDLVSHKNHRNARLNPKAHFHHKTVEMTDIQTGQTVAAPLRLFDCCPISDGAAAAIVSRSLTNERSIRVLGSSVSSDVISLSQRPDKTTFAAARDAGARAYQQAGLAPTDIQIAEVHDCFTIAELVAMEDLGFAEPGGAAARVRAGDTMLAGALPINTGGGLKAGGHAIGATGVGQVYELVTQLRGEAGDRQVSGVSRGLAHNVGGVGGTCAVHILGGDQR